MIFQILMVDLFVTNTIWLLLHPAWFIIAVIGDLMEHLLVRITKENGIPSQSILDIMFGQGFTECFNDQQRVMHGSQPHLDPIPNDMTILPVIHLCHQITSALLITTVLKQFVLHVVCSLHGPNLLDQNQQQIFSISWDLFIQMNNWGI